MPAEKDKTTGTFRMFITNQNIIYSSNIENLFGNPCNKICKMLTTSSFWSWVIFVLFVIVCYWWDCSIKHNQALKWNSPNYFVITVVEIVTGRAYELDNVKVSFFLLFSFLSVIGFWDAMWKEFKKKSVFIFIALSRKILKISSGVVLCLKNSSNHWG